MPSAKIMTMAGAEAGSAELNPAVFDAPVNPQIIRDAVLAIQNARRQGNAETKTRSDVRGGGAKPYRQKGTGNARRGSTRDPILRGGGTVFGPHKRSYRQKVTTTTKRQALCCALTQRVKDEQLCVLDALSCPEPKTKPFAEMMSKLAPTGRRAVVVVAERDANVLLSARNVPRVDVVTATDVNAADIMQAHQVIIEQGALEKLDARLAETPFKREVAQ